MYASKINNDVKIVNSLQDPDSLILVYIAFLAYDSYAASHEMVNQMGGQRRQSSEHFDTDVSKLTGIARTFVDKLISEAGTFIEESEYTRIQTTLSDIVEEM